MEKRRGTSHSAMNEYPPPRRLRFLMDLIRLVEEKILSVVNEISKIFEGEIDY